MIVALIALFVATAGTATAARLITGKMIAKNAVTSPKVKNGSLLAADFRAGQLPAGPQGPQGDRGAPGAPGQNGAPGSAVAYAHVNADGTLDTTRSKNIASTSKQATGYYCIDASVPTTHVTATVEFLGGQIAAFVSDPFTSCPGSDAQVSTANSAGTGTDAPFWVLFN